jgi:hypothetical protein
MFSLTGSAVNSRVARRVYRLLQIHLRPHILVFGINEEHSRCDWVEVNQRQFQPPANAGASLASVIFPSARMIDR